MRLVGGQTMVGPLRTVVVKRPRDAFRSPEKIHREWKELGYTAPPDLDAAEAEHLELVGWLSGAGVEVLCLPPDDRTGLDSIYTFDPALVTDRGVILLMPGKTARHGEVAALREALADWGVPVLAALEGEATAEGGDTLWVDEETLVVGRSYRTNRAGCETLREILAPLGVGVVPVDLPHWHGREEVLHLLSLVSPVDRDLAVARRDLIPVPLIELLGVRGVELIDVPEDEFATLGCNVLAVGPRDVILLEGNPVTRDRLRANGCRVRELSGTDMALKGCGGPTCLTRPLLRVS